VEAIVEIGTVEIARSQRERWMSGRLAPEWARSFPQLFDADDLALAQGPQGPRGYHFIEWLAAIVLHHSTGYLALVSKYEFPRHRRKQRVVEQLLPPAVRAALRDRSEHGRAQPPDLLMYAPDLSDWFFCEVKGPGDRLGAEQEKKCRALARMSGRPVRILRFRWAPPRTPADGIVPRVGGEAVEPRAVKRPPSANITSEPVTHPLSVHGFDAVITLTPDPTENAVHWAVTLPVEGEDEPQLICSSDRFSFVNRGERQALRAARTHATKILRERRRALLRAESAPAPASDAPAPPREAAPSNVSAPAPDPRRSNRH
jgi:hypothetical protein